MPKRKTGLSPKRSKLRLFLLLFRRLLGMRVGRVFHGLFAGTFRSLHFPAAMLVALVFRNLMSLHLLLFPGKLRRLERLSVKCNFGDADRRIILPVAAQLLVLLFAL